MNLSIYKPGQGYYTRVLSAIGAGMLALAGAFWLTNEIRAFERQNPLTRTPEIFGYPSIYVQAGIVVLVIAVSGLVLYWLLNKPNIVDFMIATETEMKKVNWPSRREIIGSTWVVIAGTLMIAGLLTLIDLGFLQFFQSIGIVG